VHYFRRTPHCVLTLFSPSSPRSLFFKQGLLSILPYMSLFCQPSLTPSRCHYSDLDPPSDPSLLSFCISTYLKYHVFPFLPLSILPVGNSTSLLLKNRILPRRTSCASGSKTYVHRSMSLLPLSPPLFLSPLSPGTFFLRLLFFLFPTFFLFFFSCVAHRSLPFPAPRLYSFGRHLPFSFGSMFGSWLFTCL